MLAIRSIRPKVRNLGRFHLSKFLSTGNSDSHYDQSPSEYVAFQRRENSLLKKFKSTNKAAILRAEDVISGCTSTAPADHSNPHTCGQYQYFSLSSDEDSTENSTIIYRQLRATVPSEDKCRGLEIEKIPVLDIDHLMTVVPNMVTVSRMKPSLDHSMIAFAIDLEDEVENEASSMTGQERDRSAFFIKDIRRNIICELDVSKAVAGAARQSIVDFEWSVSSNGKILMYLVLNDSLHRPHLVTEIDISMLSSEMFPANTDNNTDTASMRIFALETAHMKEILREEDIAFNVDVGRSKDDKYVIISCHSKTSSEVAVAPVPLPLPLIDPTDIASNGFITILQRQRGLKYYVDHCDGMFYVAANLPHGPLSPLSCTPPLHSSDELHTDLSIIGYPSARLMEFTAQSRSDGRIQSNFNGWETVFPTSIDRSNPKHENVSIRDFDIFQSKIVIYGRSCGYPTVRILDLHFSAACRGGSHVEDLTAAVRAAVGSDMFSMRADVGTALDSDTSHFTVSSPLVPAMHFTIDLKTGSLLRRGLDTDGTGSGESTSMKNKLNKYRITTETVISSDGTEVLLTIVRPTWATLPSPRPFVLIGYGAYGIPVSLEFDSQTLALLEKGFYVGYAHCRGGGELGAAWYAAGRGMLKRNTFKDFKACAEYLIAKGWTSPSLLCGMGVSAGGLIMGVMANDCSHLFVALVMRHPFLDPLGAMQRPDLPLTVHEYDEFGHPDDTHALSYIRSYSPCSNIGGSREGDGDSRLGHRGGGGGGGGGGIGEGDRCNYPAMFLSTGLLDTKVSPLESMRWVQAVRAYIEKNRKGQKRGQKRGLQESHHSNPSTRTPSESVRPVVLHITSNCGHDGPSDAVEDQRLKAIEIVFMENAILERRKSLD